MTDSPTLPWPLPQPLGEEPPMPPLSVWPTGQRDPLAQLRDAGCVPGTETDTERIPPAVAAHAIALYTRPGDLVLDPDCGAGTALVEARNDELALESQLDRGGHLSRPQRRCARPAAEAWCASPLRAAGSRNARRRAAGAGR